MTNRGEWTTNDFCEQCRGFPFEDVTTSTRGIGLEIISGSTCPLCQFLDATLHVRENLPVITTSLSLYVYRDEVYTNHMPLSASKAELIGEVLNMQGPVRGVVQPLFLLPLSNNEEGKGGPVLSRLQKGNSVNPHEEAFLPYHRIHKDSIDLGFLKTCIEGCRVFHTDQCAATDESLLPSIINSSGFRLVDCEAGIITKPPKEFEYVALSYVWGSVSSASAHDTKLQSRLEDNLPSDLPNTIKDAMKITIQLGYRYLWVDKYCINQDPAYPDFKTQLGQMDLIYHGAVVTIIAAAGDDADYGIPGAGNRSRVGHSHITIDGTTWIAGHWYAKGPADISKWSTRGWTYQEDHFARRRLIFTEEQAIFECNTCRRNESTQFAMEKYQDHPLDLFGSIPGTSRSVMKLTQHIKNYTRRCLTYESDVLNALRGVFASFARDTPPVRQFWGIPISARAYWRDYAVQSQETTSLDDTHESSLEMAYGLTWIKVESASAPRRHGFPSWSWAGWTTHVTWPNGPAVAQRMAFETSLPISISIMRQDGGSAVLTKDLTDQIFLNEHDEASIYTYCLRIEAEVLQVRFMNMQADNSGLEPSTQIDWKYAAVKSGGSGGPVGLWPFSPTPFVETAGELHQSICEETFACIIVSSQHGLVVRERNGVVERLGVVVLYGYTETLLGGQMYWQCGSDAPHLRNAFPGSRSTIILG